MSTAGRINKSSIKFVPKRKIPRASSVTSSVGGTPRQVPVDLPDAHDEPVISPPKAIAPVVEEDEDDSFVYPDLPVKKAAPLASSSAGTSFGPSSSAPSFAFTPQDPSASTSRTTLQPSPTPSSSLPAPSTGHGFGPSQSAPKSPPKVPAQGFSFAASTSGPAPRSSPRPSPPRPQLDLPEPLSGSDGEGAPPGDAGSEPTQRELEQQAVTEREAEKARKAAIKKGKKPAGKKAVAASIDGLEENAELDAPTGKKPLRKPKIHKKAPAKDQAEPAADGDGQEGIGEDNGEEEVSAEASKKRKRAPAKPRAKPKAKEKGKANATGDGNEEEDPYDSDAPVKKRRPRKKKVLGETDRMLLGLDNISGSEMGDDAVSGSDDEAGNSDDLLSGDDKGKSKKRKKAVPKQKKIKAMHVVNVETTKMSDIASSRDNVEGRISSRGLELAAISTKQKDQRLARRRKMRERAARRKRGEPSGSEGDDDEVGIDKDETPAPAARQGSPLNLGSNNAGLGNGDAFGLGDDEENEFRMNEDGEDKDNDAEEEEDDDGGLVDDFYVPQMRIVDGVMVIDDSSLVVDRAKDTNMGFHGEREVIEESAKDRFVNSASWGKQGRTDKWTADETELFYDSLSRFGTDFEMIAGLFPNRTRRQIKAKWTKEDKINPKRITTALLKPKPIDLESYAKVSGQDLSGPVPEDPYDMIQRRRREREAAEKENAPYDPSVVPKKKDNDEQGLIPEDSDAEQNARGDEEDDDDDESEDEQERLDRELAAVEAAESGASGLTKGKGKAKA